MTVPPPSLPLRLGGREFPAGRLLVMASADRAPGASWGGPGHDDLLALDAVHRAVADGADAVDIGGVPPGADVDPREERDRVVPFVARVRAAYPDLVVSVGTWRAEVAEDACAAGADLIDDTWGGHDPKLPEVAAAHGAGLVCSHVGAQDPRTKPRRVSYGRTPDGVVDDVLTGLMNLARRATDAGVPPESLLVDPAHDAGKNTWHGLTLVRRTDAVVSLGYPVLMSFSRKDFVGEALDLPADQRLEGTLAATAVAAWQGAKVFRSHDVPATRRTLDMVASVRGDRPPARAVRGLA